MEVDYMDVATMVAINNLNMVTVMAVQAANNVITIVNGERMEEDMDGSMLDQYMGKVGTQFPSFFKRRRYRILQTFNKKPIFPGCQTVCNTQ